MLVLAKKIGCPTPLNGRIVPRVGAIELTLLYDFRGIELCREPWRIRVDRLNMANRKGSVG
jgi:hypothetical protein